MSAASQAMSKHAPAGGSAVRADQILAQQLRVVHQRTDRLFAWLLALEWLAGVAAALVISPRAWEGAMAEVHIHVWTATLLGALIVSLPIALIIAWPGILVTRLVVAASQMLMSALFIHLSGGRIETHFHVFGSLAFLAIYRDSRVLLTAAGVVAVEHLLRGVFWPQSVYGTLVASNWRWLEHAGWVIFEVAFLWHAIRQSLAEMKRDAQRADELARANQRFELAVDGTSDGIWDWDLETDECYYSHRYKQLFGCEAASDAEFPPHIDTLTRFACDEDRPPLLDAIAQHLRDQTPLDIVCRMRTRRNELSWFRVRGQASREAGGRPRRLAGSLSDITALKRAEDELTRAALLDKLTGLPNRSLLCVRLQAALEQARKRGAYFGLMFLDFDRFKIVNDCLGHDVGDALLCEIAHRLRGVLRCTDTISRDLPGASAARMGGDEFVVLLDDLFSPDDVTIVADRLLAALAEPYHIGQHEIISTASIGIVQASARYARAEDVLRDADTAMYEAKRAGKGRYAIFDEAMRSHVQRRLQLETDLRKAIDGGQFSLVFQPIVSLDTGRMKSVEALLRWQHPTEGNISPGEFIPIAEESELILAIGDWVLKAGARQMADWIERLGPAAPPTISLNLSRKQFARRDLDEQIRSILLAANLPADRVQLEVTEDFFASDVQHAIESMQAIKRLGVQLAIDDFGTGCSTFASLHEFPADVLKIDRSLMVGIESSRETAALVHSLAILVRNLGMSIVAEGVEKDEQVVILRNLGCEYGQGYYFARPLAVEQFEQYALSEPQCTIAGASAFCERWPELVRPTAMA